MGDEVTTKPKSFWEKPEGTTATVVNVVAVAGGGIALFTFLPAIVALMSNLFWACTFGVGTFAIVFVSLDKKFRNLAWYGYSSAMRFVTSWFVTIDPIGILKNYMEYLSKNLETMNQQISGLKGQMVRLKGIIDGNASDMKNSLALAAKAKEKSDTKNIVLQTRQAGRLQNSNITLGSLYTRMEVMYRVLSKMYDNADVLLEDLKSEVEVREQEYEMIKKSHSAMRSAMSIINGDPDKKALFEQALEVTADQVGQKIGDMDRFMELSQKVMDSVDLQNGVLEDSGIKLLAEWEQQQDSALLSMGEKKEAIDNSYDDKKVLDLGGDGPKRKGKKAKSNDDEENVMKKLI